MLHAAGQIFEMHERGVVILSTFDSRAPSSRANRQEPQQVVNMPTHQWQGLLLFGRRAKKDRVKYKHGLSNKFFPKVSPTDRSLVILRRFLGSPSERTLFVRP